MTKMELHPSVDEIMLGVKKDLVKATFKSKNYIFSALCLDERTQGLQK